VRDLSHSHSPLCSKLRQTPYLSLACTPFNESEGPVGVVAHYNLNVVASAWHNIPSPFTVIRKSCAAL